MDGELTFYHKTKIVFHVKIEKAKANRYISAFVSYIAQQFSSLLKFGVKLLRFSFAFFPSLQVPLMRGEYDTHEPWKFSYWICAVMRYTVRMTGVLFGDRWRRWNKLDGAYVRQGTLHHTVINVHANALTYFNS